MKRVGVLLIIVFISVTLSAQMLTYPIVDTDVTEFYNSTAIIVEPMEGQPFFGQDANYQGDQASYTDNGDGTVSDNITGLMWQQDPGEKMTYTDAVEMLKTFELGGYSDWRIPSIKELYSLAYFSGRCFGENAIDKFIDTSYFVQPTGDTSIGEREIDGQVWSSTHYVGLTMNGDSTIFGFNFIDGRLKGYPKYSPKDNSPNKMFFRMVRGNDQYGINNFSNNGDGTISDHATGLMWQQADDGNTYDWKEGLDYAENLSLAGYDDWRMPNAKELQSIVDYSRSPATSFSPAIDPLFYCTEIIDPNGDSGQYGYYWSSSPLKDGQNPYSDAVYFCFGLAQGLMEAPPNSGNFVLLDVHGAGAQRNDPKSGDPADYPIFKGPQGDVLYTFNFVRCVRDLNDTSSSFTLNQEMGISVFPNPAVSKITISADDLYDVLITDLSGKIVLKTKMQQTTETINIATLKSGEYFLHLTSAKSTISKKLIISK